MQLHTCLRAANQARQIEWDTGGNIDLSYASNELAGEAGELIEAALDVLNGNENYEALAEEIGDVIICCDLIAGRLDLVIETHVEILYGESDVKDILLDLAMEIGGVANTVKKQERARFGMVGAKGSLDDLRRNLQEVVVHVHRLGGAMRVPVRPCVASKFNKTSLKYGLATLMKE